MLLPLFNDMCPWRQEKENVLPYLSMEGANCPKGVVGYCNICTTLLIKCFGRRKMIVLWYLIGLWMIISHWFCLRVCYFHGLYACCAMDKYNGAEGPQTFVKLYTLKNANDLYIWSHNSYACIICLLPLYHYMYVVKSKY